MTVDVEAYAQPVDDLGPQLQTIVIEDGLEFVLVCDDCGGELARETRHGLTSERTREEWRLLFESLDLSRRDYVCSGCGAIYTRRSE